jgi:hypothetical protein
MISSYLVYHFVFIVSIVLLLPFRIGKAISLNRAIDVRYFGVFLTVILLCSLRYNVGTDYIMYENVFYKINKDIPTLMEYGYYSLNKLFGSFTNGYLYVFAVSAIVTHFFFFKVLYRESIIFWGVFFFFTFGFLFIANNIIRQAIVIPLFYWAVKFIEEKKLFKYLLFIAIGFLFHRSALFLIPFYWIDKIKFGKITWIVFLIISTVISFTSIVPIFIEKVVMLIPKYGAYASRNFESAISSGATNILYALMYIVIVLYMDKVTKKRRHLLYLNIFLVGINLSFIFMTVDFLYRISYYFIPMFSIIIPLLIRELKVGLNKSIITMFFVLISLVFWFKTLIFNDHGCVPYQSFLF